jgi:DNA-binding LacI/PurR family transcriptional regulator
LITSSPSDAVRAIYQDVYTGVAGDAPVEDAGLVVETPSTIANGRTAMHRLLAAPVRPSAVFCRTDLLALGALRAARDMGLRVPEDLSIIGHDDLVLVELSDPPLTTVRVDTARIGREATRLLLDAMSRRKSDAGKMTGGVAVDPTSGRIPTVTVKSELIVRESTARPPLGPG